MEAVTFANLFNVRRRVLFNASLVTLKANHQFSEFWASRITRATFFYLTKNHTKYPDGVYATRGLHGQLKRAEHMRGPIHWSGLRLGLEDSDSRHKPSCIKTLPVQS